MIKARILLALGVWMTILPYLGFPNSWKDVLTTLSGLGLILLSYLFFKDSRSVEKKEEKFDNFKENGDFNGTF
jgi:archaellum biogenesis protein FlaJ (TadC family)